MSSPLSYTLKKWDLIVCGAGPAGASAAAHASRAGLDVLMLESAAFPREKVCGDGLLPDAMQELKLLGLSERIKRSAYSAKGLTVYSTLGIPVHIGGSYYTFPRAKLDAVVANHAVNLGVYFENATVTRVISGDMAQVFTSDGNKYQAKAVIIATGAHAARQIVGLPKMPHHSAVAIRSYVRSAAPLDRMIISYDRSISPGYAWIFPMGDSLFNVGIGVFGSPKGLNLLKMFDLFFEKCTPARELTTQHYTRSTPRGGILRTGGEGLPAQVGSNVIVAGEAAGATLALTGEGIGKALYSGRKAALAVCDYLGGNKAALQEYTPVPQQLHDGYKVLAKAIANPVKNNLIATCGYFSGNIRSRLQAVLEERLQPESLSTASRILAGMISSPRK